MLQLYFLFSLTYLVCAAFKKTDAAKIVVSTAANCYSIYYHFSTKTQHPPFLSDETYPEQNNSKSGEHCQNIY